MAKFREGDIIVDTQLQSWMAIKLHNNYRLVSHSLRLEDNYIKRDADVMDIGDTNICIGNLYELLEDIRKARKATSDD